jgi:hypothetical protein
MNQRGQSFDYRLLVRQELPSCIMSLASSRSLESACAPPWKVRILGSLSNLRLRASESVCVGLWGQTVSYVVDSAKLRSELTNWFPFYDRFE